MPYNLVLKTCMGIEFANINMRTVRVYLQYSIRSSFTIIGFAIWPDLPKTQSLNDAIKCPTVCHLTPHIHTVPNNLYL